MNCPTDKTIDPQTRSIVGDVEAAALMNSPKVREQWTV